MSQKREQAITQMSTAKTHFGIWLLLCVTLIGAVSACEPTSSKQLSKSHFYSWHTTNLRTQDIQFKDPKKNKAIPLANLRKYGKVDSDAINSRYQSHWDLAKPKVKPGGAEFTWDYAIECVFHSRCSSKVSLDPCFETAMKDSKTKPEVKDAKGKWIPLTGAPAQARAKTVSWLQNGYSEFYNKKLTAANMIDIFKRCKIPCKVCVGYDNCGANFLAEMKAKLEASEKQDEKKKADDKAKRLAKRKDDSSNRVSDDRNPKRRRTS